MKVVRWVARASLVVGCGEALPSPARLDRLRVLALECETPDVRPAATARVRAVWFTPDRRAVTAHWRVCGDASDDPRRCAEASRGSDLAGDAEVEVGPSWLTLPAGAARADVVVYLVLCAGVAPTVDASTGRWGCPEDAGVEAFRRITVRAEGALNHPPSIATWTAQLSNGSVTLGEGIVLRGRACAGDCAPVTLSLSPASGSAEPVEGEAPEALMTSFVSSDGELTPPRDVAAPGVVRAMTARWTPSRVPSTDDVTLGVVLRDQRGGEATRVARVRWAAE